MADAAATASTVEVQWCDEANGAYIVVCSAHGVVDYAPTEPEAETKAGAHRLADATPEPEHTVRTTDVTELGLRLMLPIETYRLTNAHAYLCTRCGVPVIDVKGHEQWHATLQQAMGLIAGALETLGGLPHAVTESSATDGPVVILCADGTRHWDALVVERLTFTFADKDLPDRVRTLLTVADHQGCGPHTAWKERTTLVRWDEPEPPVHDLHSGGPTSDA